MWTSYLLVNMGLFAHKYAAFGSNKVAGTSRALEKTRGKQKMISRDWQSKARSERVDLGK